MRYRFLILAVVVLALAAGADEGNLRGRTVSFVFDGRPLRGEVITRIRGTRWMIQCRQLPRQYERGFAFHRCRRIILDRTAFTVESVHRPSTR